MKTFKGTRSESRTVVTCNGDVIPYFLNVRNHSPTGFEWGYRGSGPAQLALALLCMVVEDRRFIEEHYQTFKEQVIGRIQTDEWELTDREILFWCANQPK